MNVSRKKSKMTFGWLLDFEYPGVDWRDSPKEDKQKFTKLCEVK